MRSIPLFLIFAALLPAQDNSLLSVLRGSLLEWDSTAPRGDISVRGADFQVQRCSFDERSYFERSSQRISVTQLNKGQQLEIIADHNGSPSRCYARAIRVVDAPPAVAASPMRPRIPTGRALPPGYGSGGSYNSVYSSLDSILPRGNVTMAGVVLRLNGDSMLVRTRADGQKSIMLRQDTRYLQGGSPVAASRLQVNDRIFIRCGKNLEDELEAYQIVWGEILHPRE